MFNRKKIKALKENLKAVNDQRLQLRNENIIYQKELMALKEMANSFQKSIETLCNLMIENNNLLKKKKTTKKVVKKDER